MLTFCRASKSWGHGVQTGPRPQASSLKETWHSLALHFLSFLVGVRPRHKHDVTSVKLTQRRAEAGAWRRHWGAAVPGVKEGGDGGGESGISFCSVCFLPVYDAARKSTELRSSSIIPTFTFQAFKLLHNNPHWMRGLGVLLKDTGTRCVDVNDHINCFRTLLGPVESTGVI